MSDQVNWYLNQLDELIEKSQDYKEKAILEGTKDLILDQVQRRQQNEGELDGSLWSPGEWG